MKQFRIFIIIIAFLLFLFLLNKNMLSNTQEGYYNYNLNNTGLHVNSSNFLLSDMFQLTNKKVIGNTNYKNIWFLFPHTNTQSFNQVTNNLKYVRNPDISNAIPAEFNGLFYKDNLKHKSNIVCPLQPVITEPSQVRVGYFNTNIDLLY